MRHNLKHDARVKKMKVATTHVYNFTTRPKVYQNFNKDIYFFTSGSSFKLVLLDDIYMAIILNKILIRNAQNALILN